jgi:radical SAM superfamily enzyme YgiQ (UPF0313 family)
MKILLLAMPDTVSALDAILKVPNLGLCSLAGNLDGSETRILDLSFQGKRLDSLLIRTLREFAPDLVGLSAMSFQFQSACHVARLVKSLRPGTATVLGGYHASLMAEEIGLSPQAGLFDFIVRGEGERTLADLVRKRDARAADFSDVPGLSFRDGAVFRHNPPAELLDLDAIRLPDRTARRLGPPHFLGLRLDCAETSRGCVQGCKFCSIARMYGRAIRYFPLERVIEDLSGLKAGGTDGVFFVDDNITSNVRRLSSLCGLIVREKLETMFYVIQASVPGIVSDPDLAARLAAAGFRWVFLGIENPLDRNLRQMGKSGSREAAAKAVRLLRGQGIGVFGGFIVGHPEDDRTDIETVFRFAFDLGVDHAIVQVLTPYPRTETRRELLEAGLVTNATGFSRYNGFIANVRTRHLDSGEISRAMLWAGLKLYFHPRYILRSRLWRCAPSLIRPLAANNFRYLAEGWRNRVFRSRHTWT